ncbi:transcriptional regulator [Pseudomonas xionganensis]|uniref:Transcriptional regulator n=1 Tax=Pseudomonas xionganensis TaxID=2654845 RepID=A0A6I4KYV0_9PSED|nr:transcriptional regulator [Pseudomonas xionganensis]MVW75972.1 transcriptional regulator [Pseudomonas xionganensis]
MLDVLQLKHRVNRMPLDKVRLMVDELQLEGIVTEGKTPFNRVHFNTCFAEIEALLQRAGYHRQLDVVGYQGLAYALFDPGRWQAVEVLHWLRDYVEERQAQPAS